jgi:SAM-dependent methyltransferase
MSVSTHLGIRLDEYDTRIRTFIPDYDAMLTAAAETLRTLDAAAPHIVDLGTGTGALAAQCLRVRDRARLTAIDEDEGILDMARARLAAHGDRLSTIAGNFTTAALPACDAILGSLAFHHVRTREAKRGFYARCAAALRPGGLLVIADCCPPTDERLAARTAADWRQHMAQHYGPEEIDGYFAAWAADDVYFPLLAEQEMVRDSGLMPDVAWRRGMFAVVTGRKS